MQSFDLQSLLGHFWTVISLHQLNKFTFASTVTVLLSTVLVFLCFRQRRQRKQNRSFIAELSSSSSPSSDEPSNMSFFSRPSSAAQQTKNDEYYQLMKDFASRAMTNHETKNFEPAKKGYEKAIEIGYEAISSDPNTPHKSKIVKLIEDSKGCLQLISEEQKPVQQPRLSVAAPSPVTPRSRPLSAASAIPSPAPISPRVPSFSAPSAPSSSSAPIRRKPAVPTQASLSKGKAAASSSASSIPNPKCPPGVDPQAFEKILNEVLDRSSSITFDSIAGLEYAKKVIKENVLLPQLRPDFFDGVRTPARGVLLFGPPGTGKTMLAKAVASESGMRFFAISASSLMSKWVGEGEKMVRALFAAARALQPAVIFIDEVDSILTARSSSEHDATRRMKTEVLVQMEGVSDDSAASRVLVMAATNLPQQLDDAFLRRMQKRIYIPLPDLEARKAFLGHQLSQTKHSISARELHSLSQATENFSCSDLRAVIAEAVMMPLREVGSFDQLIKIAPGDLRPISSQDVLEALKTQKPSVRKEDLKALDKWSEQYGSGL